MLEIEGFKTRNYDQLRRIRDKIGGKIEENLI